MSRHWLPTKKTVRTIALVITVLFVVAILSKNLKLIFAFGVIAGVLWYLLINKKFEDSFAIPKSIISNPKKDLEMYAKSAEYREMVYKKYENDAKKQYDSSVRSAQASIDSYERQRVEKLTYLQQGKWRSESKIRVNEPLGMVSVNGNEVYYNAIQGAEVTTLYSQRYEEEEHQESVVKRSPSVGGAIVGGLVGGVAGAAVGAALFSKKEGASDRQARGRTIPTCTYVGVKANLSGFVYEIPILDHTVDQGTPEFNNAISEATRLVDRLRALSQTPIPHRVLNPESNPEILQLDRQIAEARDSLSAVMMIGPVVELPARYSNLVTVDEDEIIEQNNNGRDFVATEVVSVPVGGTRQKKFCPDCGTPVTGSFCSNCGRKL